MKKIIIESHIPFVPDELREYFNIVRLKPEEINSRSVIDADGLIVRTRTRCDSSLLEGSKCNFVATATIGTDHFDLPYLASRGIEAVSAPGCNAPAVAQYVMASILSLYFNELDCKTIGIVGVGNVGSIVDDWAKQLGINVLLCDPLRAEIEGSDKFVSLEEIAEQSDIVTFHTPHTKEGPYPTHHLADESFFGLLKKKPLFINSARGPIVDTQALLTALHSGKVSRAIIDCWENEPFISKELLNEAPIATPHIAGYSLNGKIRATAMVINALCHHFGVYYRYKTDIPAGAAKNITRAMVLNSYSPLKDTMPLKSTLRLEANEAAVRFEELRNNYRLREEV